MQIHGKCPLLIGAERNDIEMVKLCIKYPQTDLSIADTEGKTALILAVKSKNIHMVNTLLREEYMGRINAEHLNVSWQFILEDTSL